MRRICLASPIEPSGASWLVNCLLELGVRVCHKPVVDNLWRHSTQSRRSDVMWLQLPTGRWRLHPRARPLQKWLPALSRHASFEFRTDVDVEYVQDVAAAADGLDQTVLFVRDPRDSLYSMYRRMEPALSYAEFLRFPNPDSLVDRPSHWARFVDSWLAHAGSAWFTFEDYKRDAPGLLRRIVECLSIASDDDAIEQAVRESSFEQAHAAEARFRAQFTGDWEVANRAGRVGQWTEQTEARGGSQHVEARAGHAMRRLGYDAAGGSGSEASPAEADAGDDLSAFSRTVDETVLRATNLPDHRTTRLLENLAERADRERWGTGDRVRALQRAFTDDPDRQLDQVRDLLQRRRSPPAQA